MTRLLSTDTLLLLGALLVMGLVFRAVVVREPDRRIAKLIVLGVIAKLAGTALFHFILVGVYDESGDTTHFFRRGIDIAPVIRSGSLPDQARETGTPFMDFLAGLGVAAVGPNQLLVNVVFSLLAFVGMYLFLQAFRTGVPDGDHRRYAFLVLLLPTMVFWSSTLGKEAWLVFTLGVSAYGAARALRRLRFGHLLVGLGIAGVFAMRPHMAALLSLSFVCAYLVRSWDPTVKRGIAGWLIGVSLLVVGAGFITTTSSEEMARGDSVESTGAERVREQTSQLFERTEEQTSRGGSEFDSRSVRTPIDFLHALVTVPFRPFPTEAHNRVAQLASLESIALLLVVVVSIPRLMSLPGRALRRPFLLMVSAYVIGFIIAFSNVGNFGILVRQRVQLLPFLLMLLAVPAAVSANPARALRARVPESTPPVAVAARAQEDQSKGVPE